MTTPSGARIWAERPGVAPVDVTEAVQVVYDLVLSSMDFGSGFLSVEEVIPLARLAEVCGFDDASPHGYIKEIARGINATYEPNRKQAVLAAKWLEAHT